MDSTDRQIIDDVTFSLVSQSVTVNFIDGSQKSYPINQTCIGMLHRVCKEVELSFAPAAAVTATPESTPAHSRQTSGSSIASSSSRQSISHTARRSTSSLLLSLLSPLLPSPASAQVSRIPPARVHRRQARSLLVDTFRRFVLPTLKAELPAAYLPWSIASESARRLKDFEGLRVEVDRILAETGMEKGTRAPLKRYRTFSAGSVDSDNESTVSCDSASSTPATSIYSSLNGESSPQCFLLSIPPAHALPASHQPAYTAILQRLTHIASRLHSIARLNSRYEKEESKRLWLESLERGRAVDKALRCAWSNGGLKRGVSIAVGPTTRSNLWRSVTAEEVAQEERRLAGAIHPAMMEDDEPGMVSDVEDAEVVDVTSPVTPSAPAFTHAAVSIRLGPLEPCYELLGESFSKLPSRPTLERSVTPVLAPADPPSPPSSVASDEDDLDASHPLPSLYASSSSESLSSSGEWDDELRTPSPPPADDSDEETEFHAAGIHPPTKTKGFQWAPYPTSSDAAEAEADRPKSRLAFRRRASELDAVSA